jgi:predicted component of type VI protein secretion system
LTGSDGQLDLAVGLRQHRRQLNQKETAMAFLIQKKVDGSIAERWELGRAPLVVGRGEKAHARIADAEMSRQHFEIAFKDGTFALRDLDSKNGTFVNGRRTTEVQLKFDDQIRAGETHFAFADRAGVIESMPTISGMHHPKQLRKN